jgi:hypothetical protein
MNMDRFDFDTWSDDLDLESLNKKGKAVLKRRFIKNDRFLTLSDNAPIVAEGITAFLFSNNYSGGLQLLPINFQNASSSVEFSKYFQKYFEICRKFYMISANSKPDSVHKKLDEEFILSHIKQEEYFCKKYRSYFERIQDVKEKENRKNFVKSYLKWIKHKQNPLKLSNYLELSIWGLLCFLIVSLIILELFWTKEEWNFVPRINKAFTNSDDFQNQIVTFLLLALIGSIVPAFKRMKKILNTHNRL